MSYAPDGLGGREKAEKPQRQMNQSVPFAGVVWEQLLKTMHILEILKSLC